MASGNPPISPLGAENPYRAVVVVVGWVVIAVACLVLVGGWALGVAPLRSVIPGAVGMKALSALGLLSTTASLLLLVDVDASSRRRAAGVSLAVAPGILAALVLGEYVTGRGFGIDELLFVDHDGRANNIASPGRFAPTTGLCFLLMAAALLLLDSRPRGGWRPAEVAAIPVAIVAGVAILGYAYSLPEFYGPASAAKMAVNTAGCFVGLAASVVLARPHGRLLRLATTTDPGGVMMRRLGPFVLTVPLLLGWLHLRTVKWGLLEPEAAAWWLSAATMLALVVIVAWCATILSRADGGRRMLEQEMKDARDHAVEVSRVKSDFVASTSHEIRTPLNGVIGMTQLLLDTPLNVEQREYGQAIRSSGDALMAVIGDILDVSKIEAGKLEIEEASFALEELVISTSALMAGQARAKGIDLITTVDASLPVTVAGDAVRVRQVLLNLISNAVKFTSEGEVSVKVGSQPGSDGMALVRFEVSDTGIGVPSSAVETLFDSFTQIDSSTTRRYGGTGLGLAISKQLVELMHGQIGADSAPSRGSRFWFTLPLAVVVESKAARLDRRETAPALVGSDPAPEPAPSLAPASKVLVAEDNEINQLVASRMLQKLGYEVKIAANGREAVDLHASGGYAVILMDCQMPDLDGYDATRQIRSNEAGGRHTPIIAMTANTMQGDRDNCISAGMDDYVSKPLRSDALGATVARALSAAATCGRAATERHQAAYAEPPPAA